jgi:predicted component of viral defense system (DUF524 family)
MPILAQIETDAWKLDVVGKVTKISEFVGLPPSAKIGYTGAGVLRLRSSSGELESVIAEAVTQPFLFENTEYDFYLETKSGTAELALPPTGVLRHQFGATSHHRLNFRNDVGLVDLMIKSSETGLTCARFEVFPTKIDYRTDYVQLRDEVASISRNLVMTVQARTFGTASAIPIKQPTLVEWLSLIRHYFHSFVASANAIARSPHSRLKSTTSSIPVDRSRKVNGAELRKLLRRPVSRVGFKFGTLDLPARVPGISSTLTFDTAENRYVKALLLQTCTNLQRIIRTTATGDEDADLTAEEKFFEAVRPEAGRMLRQLQTLLKAPYLKEVSIAPIVRPRSMVLHQHPQYAAFARAARLFNCGLVIEGGPIQVGLKDIALLYEYWCFLKLVSLLAEKFSLEQQTFVRVKHTRITVTLQKGVEAAIRYRDQNTGRVLLLLYNRLFDRLPTIAQRPDNVIQLSSEDNLYIFDAKYRLSFEEQYQNRFGGVGPMTDDISTMHRYRDALVIRAPATGFSRVVRGAVVLFPFADETTYRKHKFFESLASVEIGGLPFLPNATTLVTAKLNDLLAASGFSSGPSEPGSGCVG